MIVRLERKEVPPHAAKLNSLMPSSYHVSLTFCTALVQTNPNSLELLKTSPFQRPDFSLGEGLGDLQRELPISPLIENIRSKRERPGHIFWRLTEKLIFGKMYWSTFFCYKIILTTSWVRLDNRSSN